MDSLTGVPGPQNGRERPLTPTQEAVRSLLLAYPDGVCRRDFATNDLYEVSNRISEIESRLGVTIHRGRCKKHQHRHPVTLYRI